MDKLDDIWLSYDKYKKGDVFLRHSVYNQPQINSAFHPSGVDKSSTSRFGWG